MKQSLVEVPGFGSNKKYINPFTGEKIWRNDIKRVIEKNIQAAFLLACPIERHCPVCNKIITCSQIKRVQGRYLVFPGHGTCSTSCSRSYQNRERYKKYPKLLARFREKSIAHSRNCSGKTLEEIYGEKRGKKLRRVISKNLKGDNNPRWGKNYRTHEEIEANREATSRTGKLKLGKTLVEMWGSAKAEHYLKALSKRMTGKGNPQYGKPSNPKSGNGWKGKYNGRCFRSLLELACVLELERKGIAYESGEQKKYAVPYTTRDGVQRNYYPDFITEDGAIETKPSSLLRANEKKFLAAKKHFSKFTVLTEKDLVIPRLDELDKLVDSGKLVWYTCTLKYIEKYRAKHPHFAVSPKILTIGSSSVE